MQRKLASNSFLEYTIGMATVTQYQLVQFAYKEGVKGGPLNCPRSYLGYVIPEMFEDGALAFGIWRQAYNEGRLRAAESEKNHLEAAQGKWHL
jgi:hypothetical protein